MCVRMYVREDEGLAQPEPEESNALSLPSCLAASIPHRSHIHLCIYEAGICTVVYIVV